VPFRGSGQRLGEVSTSPDSTYWRTPACAQLRHTHTNSDRADHVHAANSIRQRAVCPSRARVTQAHDRRPSELRSHRIEEPAATMYEHDRECRIRRNHEIMEKLGLAVRGGGDCVCGVDRAFDGRKITKKALAALDLMSSLTQHEVEDLGFRGEDPEHDQPPELANYFSDSSEDSEEVERVVVGTNKDRVDHRQELFREAESLLCMKAGRG